MIEIELLDRLYAAIFSATKNTKKHKSAPLSFFLHPSSLSPRRASVSPPFVPLCLCAFVPSRLGEIFLFPLERSDFL